MSRCTADIPALPLLLSNNQTVGQKEKEEEEEGEPLHSLCSSEGKWRLRCAVKQAHTPCLILSVSCKKVLWLKGIQTDPYLHHGHASVCTTVADAYMFHTCVQQNTMSSLDSNHSKKESFLRVVLAGITLKIGGKTKTKTARVALQLDVPLQ